MNSDPTALLHGEHHHIFLGAGHATNERRAWAVIALCSAMMVLEIGGGAMFGSLALIADGLHMSTHAAALLIAALAYTYARRHATDRRFVFGTGKLGDLAGFTSAIVLAMIALVIGVEAVRRFFDPAHINFAQAIPIAYLGLAVNIASAWLLGGGHEHVHGHAHEHPHPHAHSHEMEPAHEHEGADLAAHRDNNLRSAFVHVLGDAVVSVLAILGLTAGRYLGWVVMDPVMGLVGAAVIAAWAYALVRATGRILLDMNPDATMAGKIRALVETQGDRVADLHLWRLGPGHFGAILSVVTSQAGAADFYRDALRHFAALSHVTVEVLPPMPVSR